MTVLGSALHPARADAGAPAGRYCDLCGEPAAHADLLPDGRTLHRTGVCCLFDMSGCAGQAVPESVISSYRLLNHYAPVMVLATQPRTGRRVALGLRVCVWRRDEDGWLWLVPAGTPFAREFPAADSMPMADPVIRSMPLAPRQMPPRWLEPRLFFEP